MTKSLLLKALLVGVALASIYAAWQALRWGIADRHAYDAVQIIKQWEPGSRPTDAEILKATELTQAAVQWAPDHPEYRDQLARLLTVQFLITRDVQTAQEAKQHLLHSQSIRPAWAKNWAAYIELKHHLAEVDESFFNAIKMAVTSGPWEPATLQSVAKAGTPNFSRLPPDIQDHVLENLERGLNSPLGGLPDRTAEFTRAGVRGWNQKFLDHLAESMSQPDWKFTSQIPRTSLSLLIWPFLDQYQRSQVIINVAEATVQRNNNDLLNLVAREGKLSQFCPAFPRQERFRSACENSRIIR